MSIQSPAVESGLTWIDAAVEEGCPEWSYPDPTRRVIDDVLREVQREAGADAVSEVARALADRAEAGRRLSATEARKVGREALRDRGVELTMASPLARSGNG